MESAPALRHHLKRPLVTGGLAALAVLAIWTSFILIARASAVQHSLLPLDIAWLRFAFAGLVALPVLAWQGRRWLVRLAGVAQQDFSPDARRTAVKRAAALAATAGVGYCSLAYSAFFFAPAAHGAVLMPGTLPLWTALLALPVLGERLTRARAAGLGLILLGGMLVGGHSLLLAATGRDGTGVWRGDLMFLCAASTWAMYSVLCRRWRVGALDATLGVALGCVASVVPLYGVAALLGLVPSQLGAAPWREVAFQAVYQGGLAMWVAGMAFTHVVACFGPLRTSMLTALVPPTAALLAVPLLGEALAPAALAGLACVTAGLLLGLRSARPAATPAIAVLPAAR